MLLPSVFLLLFNVTILEGVIVKNIISSMELLFLHNFKIYKEHYLHLNGESIIWLLYLFILIITLIILLYISLSISLKAISHSLSNNDVSKLDKLKKQKSGFGKIASLIIQFFRHKEKLENEIIEKRIADKNIKKLKDIYAVINQINHAIVRVNNKQKLFDEICRIAVEYGNFKMAWIGIEERDTGIISPIAAFGIEKEVMDTRQIRTNSSTQLIRKIIESFQTKNIFVANNLNDNPIFEPWKDRIIRKKYNSLATLPIMQGETFVGGLNLFSEEIDFFDEQEISLLKEVTYDIGFALHTLDEEEKKEIAEESLRLSEERWQIAIEASGDGMFDWNVQTNECFFSKQWKSLLGYEDDEIKNMFSEWQKRIYYDDTDIIKIRINRHLKGETPFFMAEYRLLRKDGSYRWFLTRGKVISRDEKGRPLHVVGTNSDINKRKLSEKAVEESQAQLNGIINYAMDAIISFDSEQKIILFNSAAVLMFNVQAADAVGKEIFSFISRPYINKLLDYIEVFDKIDIENVKMMPRIIEGIRNDKEFPMEVSISKIKVNDKVIYTAILRDITERVKAEEQIRKLSQSVVQSPASIVITGLDGNIEYVNPKCCEITGYTFEELLGTNPRILKSGETPASEYKKMWDTITSGKEWTGEFHNKKKSGELYWESALISPIKDTNGKTSHYLAVKEDITQRKKMQQELIIAKEKAEEMSRLKTNFLANMSHELRTPMIAVLGYSEILKDVSENIEEKSISEIIYKSGSRLMKTLNMILDLSRIETDKVEIEFSQVNVNAIIIDIISQFQKQADEKNLVIDKVFKVNPLLAEIDDRIVMQIIYNLVNNAVKFTKQGSVIIETSIEKIDEKDWAVIKVKDTGIGISFRNLQLIFEEFRQESEGYGRNFEGIGLGLTITRKFVNLMNGQISVESKQRVGSVFTVKLPVIKPIPAKVEEEISLTDQKRNKHISLEVLNNNENLPQVLLVEDDLINQQVIKLYLKNTCSLDVSDNAEDVLQKVTKNKYAAILMDINLNSNVTGVHILKQIKKLPEYKDVPVVAVTAFVMEEDKKEFFDAGFNYYLSKPFNKKTLLKLIEEIIPSTRQ
jgi:hypothetical protein